MRQQTLSCKVTITNLRGNVFDICAKRKTAYGIKNLIQEVAHKDAHRVTAHRCAGGLKEKLDQRSGLHATGFFSVENHMAFGARPQVQPLLQVLIA